MSTNKFTVVTGFFDINRDKWKTKHKRSNEKYFEYIENLMGLDVNLIIFCESKNVKKFTSFRKGKEKQTVFVIKTFEDLEMYPHIDKMRECQTNPQIMKGHPDPTCPEYKLPEYNVLVNSKFGLLRDAINLNPFKTDFFCWMDAGYTHSTINLKNKKYNPTLLFNYPNKITFSQLAPVSVMAKTHYSFFIQHIDIVSAGFFFGKKEAILDFQKIYHEYYKNILYKESISDDEQFYMALLLREQPELFNPIYMNWFGSLSIK